MSTHSSRLSVEELPDLLCGRWIDATNIETSRSDTVIIPLGSPRLIRRLVGETEAPPESFSHQLVIRHVSRIDIHDEAEIGQYDITDVFYDSDAQELTIRSSFPFVLKVAVSALSLELQSRETSVT